MKILIAYTTRFGTTEKCVKILADMLRENNYDVEIADLKKNGSIKPENYDMVLVGGSFLVGRMNSYVNKFVKRNLNTLLKVKAAVFMCGSDENWENEIKKGFPEELLNKSIARGYFGYEFNLAKMNPMFRGMIQKATNTTERVSKINTENIGDFAGKVSAALN
jgi:menaquinone-dependent protoporphyrinogen oxidase